MDRYDIRFEYPEPFPNWPTAYVYSLLTSDPARHTCVVNVVKGMDNKTDGSYRDIVRYVSSQIAGSLRKEFMLDHSIDCGPSTGLFTMWAMMEAVNYNFIAVQMIDEIYNKVPPLPTIPVLRHGSE